MKTTAALLIALWTVSVVFANNVHRNSNANEFDSDYDQQQGQSGQESAWNQQHHWNSPDATTNSEDPLATEWADVLPFHTKITQRIENSERLSNQPKIKEKLMKFLEDKVHVCRTASSGKNKVNKQCMGRLTGQMMQMIAAFENGSQNIPDSYDW